ncbi:unnamed protein product [Blepharisma stoltei]|uniref:Uncharacterized protein n=1 Tax=Blepharisma stoltei TaxID=1481888 RepID=A0AAU9IS77_9CILI|nr:unnamed protein product [Blepharisma stoltei]
MMIFILFVPAIADYLYWDDQVDEKYYDWSSLQRPDDLPYTYYTDDYEILYNFGTDIDLPCNGKKGSAIRRSFTSDECVILGNHEFSAYKSFEFAGSEKKGIKIMYLEGDKCKKNDFGNRIITFQLVCSDIESDFQLLNDINDCNLVLEKYTYLGCEEDTRNQWIANCIFTASAVLLLVCIAACLSDKENEIEVESNIPVWREMKTVIRRSKIFASNNISKLKNSEYENV